MDFTVWRLGPQQLESHLPWLLQPQFNGTLKTWMHFIQTTTYVALGELLTVSYSRPQASQVVPVVKNWPANAGDVRYAGLIPGSGKIPWSRKWQPTPVFLPGKSHAQRSLAGYRS